MLRWGDVIGFLGGVVRKNLGLKAVAVGLAVALWWFVAGESKVQLGIVVPLEIRNAPAGVTIANKVERQVEVRISGPPSLLVGVQQSDITAAIDLASAKPGRQVFRLDDRAVRVPPGIKVQRIYPDTIEVVLERLESKALPVVPRIGGEAKLKRRIRKVEVEPPTLLVEALPEELARLKSLPTPEVRPEDSQGSYSANVRVDVRDGHAKIVGNPNVRVTIHFR